MGYRQAAIFLVGIALTVLILSFFGLQETAGIILRARPGILAIAVLLQLAILALFILRIKILARGKGFVSVAHAARLTFSGVFINMITPLAKLGGEPLKMYMLGKNIGSYNASAAIAIESLSELVSSFIVILAVTAVFFGMIPAEFTLLFAAVLVGLGAGIGIFVKVLTTPRWLHGISRWFVKKISRIIASDDKDHVFLFSTALTDIWKKKWVVASAVIVSVAVKILELLRFWLIFLALGIALPPAAVVVVWSVLLVVAFIPWLPGSLGLVEFSGITTLLLFGVMQTSAASAIVLDRFISLWLPLFVTFIGLSMAKRRGELPDLSSWRKSQARPMQQLRKEKK